MTNRFIQPGEVMDYLATAAVAVNDVVVAGDRIGIAINNIPNGERGSVRVSGVFSLPKVSANVIAQGAKVFWDATAKAITTTEGTNKVAGYAFAGAAAGTALVAVKINA
ncbi:MAG: DUF2190 family protein [Candidatus Dactylopiibacterium sp.]|nr:DUF2190 family protein [Candidatus Dactylopiibacterium sp.]